MCPRPYRSTRRQESTEATRARIVEAARRLLAVSTGTGGFSVDLVAREADVARATVYYQFGSKRALYDAVADDLAVRADIGGRLGAAFALAAAPDVLDAVVAAFGDGVVAADGALDRQALAETVFADKLLLAKLNDIVHPLVGQRVAEIERGAPAGSVVVYDVPLLVENDMADGFDLVVVVEADEALRLGLVSRVVAADGFLDDVLATAAGIAAIGSVFYAALPDSTAAVRTGFLLVVAFVGVALAVAAVDLVVDRRSRAAAENQEPASVR